MIDPQAQAVLDMLLATPPLDQVGVDSARELAAKFAPPKTAAPPGVSVSDDVVAGVPVRVYRPRPEPNNSPVIVYIHSGGWIIGNLDGADRTCLELASSSGLSVVSVDYRLSPEAQYPLPLDDCISVLKWIYEEGAHVGFDPQRICVAGESSGGNLAAASCIRAQQLAIPVAFQLLVCPVIDSAMDSDSWSQLGAVLWPPSSQLSWMWDLYAGTTDTRANDPLVNLSRLTGALRLPPTLILTAEYDPLRDEAEQYGRRLADQGIPTEVRRIPGQIHGFFGLLEAVDSSRVALHDAAKTVAMALQG